MDVGVQVTSVEDCCLEKNMNHCSPVEFRLVPAN